MSTRLHAALTHIGNLQRKLAGCQPTTSAILIKSKLALASQLIREAEELEEQHARELISATTLLPAPLPPPLPKHWVRPISDNTDRLRPFPLPDTLPLTPVVEEALSYHLHASVEAVHSLAASQDLPVLFHEMDEEQTQILLIDKSFVNERGQECDVWGLDIVTLGKQKAKDNIQKARKCWPQVILFPENNGDFLIIHFYKIEPTDVDRLSKAIAMRKTARKLNLALVSSKEPEIIKV
jgi:hypothetical protein